jgi:hypothetical protein
LAKKKDDERLVQALKSFGLAEAVLALGVDFEDAHTDALALESATCLLQLVRFRGGPDMDAVKREFVRAVLVLCRRAPDDWTARPDAAQALGGLLLAMCACTPFLFALKSGPAEDQDVVLRVGALLGLVEFSLKVEQVAGRRA